MVNNHLSSILKWIFKNKPGSSGWFIQKEKQYGGMHTNIPRRKVSSLDPRSSIEIVTGGMTGGDRMSHHGYARYYEKYLVPYIESKNHLTVVEVGVLKGVGLAIWCDLFPHSRVMGFDIDLSHFQDNYENLKGRGGFSLNSPEVYEFDQFIDNTHLINDIVGNNKIDIIIDDGFHSVESILTTINSVKGHLSDFFVYFIEDNSEVSGFISDMYSSFNVDSFGELTILTSK